MNYYNSIKGTCIGFVSSCLLTFIFVKMISAINSNPAYSLEGFMPLFDFLLNIALFAFGPSIWPITIVLMAILGGIAGGQTD